MTLSLGPRVRRRALMPHMPRRLLPVVAQRPRCRCTTRGGGRPRLHERGDPVNESCGAILGRIVPTGSSQALLGGGEIRR